MNIDCGVEFTEVPEYGVVLKCSSVEIADKFEDYLTENCYVFFNVRMYEEYVLFYFGQASSISKVKLLYDYFKEGINK